MVLLVLLRQVAVGVLGTSHFTWLCSDASEATYITKKHFPPLLWSHLLVFACKCKSSFSVCFVKRVLSTSLNVGRSNSFCTCSWMVCYETSKRFGCNFFSSQAVIHRSFIISCFMRVSITLDVFLSLSDAGFLRDVVFGGRVQAAAIRQQMALSRLHVHLEISFAGTFFFISHAKILVFSSLLRLVVAMQIL